MRDWERATMLLPDRRHSLWIRNFDLSTYPRCYVIRKIPQICTRLRCHSTISTHPKQSESRTHARYLSYKNQICSRRSNRTARIDALKQLHGWSRNLVCLSRELLVATRLRHQSIFAENWIVWQMKRRQRFQFANLIWCLGLIYKQLCCHWTSSTCRSMSGRIHSWVGGLKDQFANRMNGQMWKIRYPKLQITIL